MIAPTDTVLHVRNYHVAGCGTPPNIKRSGESGLYVGYFEGLSGDQWTVEIDRQAATGTLRGGDIGWNERIQIADDRIDTDLIVNDDEFAWLAACWKAATGRELRTPPFKQIMNACMTMSPEEAEARIQQFGQIRENLRQPE